MATNGSEVGWVCTNEHLCPYPKQVSDLRTELKKEREQIKVKNNEVEKLMSRLSEDVDKSKLAEELARIKFDDTIYSKDSEISSLKKRNNKLLNDLDSRNIRINSLNEEIKRRKDTYENDIEAQKKQALVNSLNDEYREKKPINEKLNSEIQKIELLIEERTKDLNSLTDEVNNKIKEYKDWNLVNRQLRKNADLIKEGKSPLEKKQKKKFFGRIKFGLRRK